MQVPGDIVYARKRKTRSKSSHELYDPSFVSGIFDRMSKTYGLTNLIASFGFTSRWRRQCINDLPQFNTSGTGYDFMSGMGEAWPEIQKRVNADGRIIAIDISTEMNRKAAEHIDRLKTKNIELKQVNVLDNDIPSESADFVISTFGIKTFNHEQQQVLANEVRRILKPGGVFAFIEISSPKASVLHWAYMIYLNTFIPLIGRAFTGDSETYRMLGRYCERFENSRFFHKCLIRNELESTYKDYFFGCASGVYGRK